MLEFPRFLLYRQACFRGKYTNKNSKFLIFYALIVPIIAYFYHTLYILYIKLYNTC